MDRHCKRCKKKPVLGEPMLCGEHFEDYLVSKVRLALSKSGVVPKKIAVAVSGGKDSLTALYMLKKLKYDVSGIAIDEGIEGYREFTLNDLHKFCLDLKIPFYITSFEERFGMTLDSIIKRISARKLPINPCNACGVLRRYLINLYSKEKGFAVVATGHNLDDEAQSTLMNVMKNHLDILLKSGLSSGNAEGFARRIKPLYFCKEKEIRLFTIIKGFDVRFVECPYSGQGFRSGIQGHINFVEAESKLINPKFSVKSNVIGNLEYLKQGRNMDEKTNSMQMCSYCDEPSSGQACRKCTMLLKLIA